MKKILAILCASALFAGVMPVTMAEETVEINTLILEEDGSALVNDSTEYSYDYGTTEPDLSLYHERTGTQYHGGKSGAYFYAGNGTNNFKFYPKLDKGAYIVSVYVPAAGYMGGLTMTTSDGISVTKSFEQNAPASGYWYNVGMMSAKGEYMTDYVQLTESVNADVNPQWRIYFDAVKFEKVSESEELTEVILEENGTALINGSTDYRSDGGKVTVSGAVGVATGTHLHGGQEYYINGGDATTAVTYYPRLNPGKYDVYVYWPQGAYQRGISLTDSNEQNKVFGYRASTAASEWRSVFTSEFTGVYGEDYITLTGYSQGVDNYKVNVDALKFVKVDERVGVWNLDDETGTENLEKYTWALEKGESVNTDSDGFKNDGWRIDRPSLANDNASTESTGIRIPVSADLVGSQEVTVNLWMRNDGRAWYQNIVEIYEDSEEKYIADVRFGDVNSGQDPLAGYAHSWHSAIEVSFKPDISYGEWHMVTLVYDFRTDTTSWSNFFKMEYYYDGEKVAEGYGDYWSGCPFVRSLTETTSIYIGADHDGNNRFNGSFDEITVYNKVLSESDIALLYNKEKRAEASITDASVSMATGTAISEDNSIVISAPSVPQSSNTFEASATANGVFDGELVYVSNIPGGLYVSGVKAENDTVTITFAGTASSEVKTAANVYAALQAYGDNTANSDSVTASIASSYDMALLSSSIDDGVYTATVINNSAYGELENVDFVVAVYSEKGKMKDVYLAKDTAVPENNSTVTITSDVLNYTDTDTVKLFAFDTIEGMQPVNAYLK